VSPDGKNVYAVTDTGNSVVVFSRDRITGALTQLSGVAGCVSEDGTGGACAIGKGLLGGESAALSPDGKNLYLASRISGAVAVFSRNAMTGELTQLSGIAGCVSHDGTGGTCAVGRGGLIGAMTVAVSPDGRHVYVGSLDNDMVAVFSRNLTTGALTQLSGTAGCVSEDGTGGACADGKGLNNVRSVALSRDGRHVYVASELSNAVAVFSRNSTTGELTQLSGIAGCVSEDGTGGACADGKGLIGAISVAVSRDGRHLYVAAGGDSVAVFSRNSTTGELTQLSGIAGCVSEDGSTGACADGKGIVGNRYMTLSGDGKHAYVASASSNAVAAFSRSPTTGVLTQLNGPDCMSDTGDGPCIDGNHLSGPVGLSLSRDGRHFYVASSGSSALAVFSRNAKTGALAQLDAAAGCVADVGDGVECADGKALDDPRSAAVSPDGRHVYVASAGSNAVAVFSRNATTGELTQLSGLAGCVSEDGAGGSCTDGKGLIGASSVAVSPNSRHVYVASSVSNTVAVFSRNATTGELTQLGGLAGCVSEDGTGGTCAYGNGLIGASSVAVSPNSRHVYVASNVSNAVAVFSRNTTTGELTQLGGIAGCVSEDGTGGGCADSTGLAGANSVAVSPDSRQVYVASNISDAVAVFSRNLTTGELTQLSGLAGCVSEDGTGGGCTDGKGLDSAFAVVVSPDRKHIYVGSSDINAVTVFHRD
jgi:6-phosphogluconolactonase (cycloisomerase 2 family)